MFDELKCCHIPRLISAYDVPFSIFKINSKWYDNFSAIFEGASFGTFIANLLKLFIY